MKDGGKDMAQAAVKALFSFSAAARKETRQKQDALIESSNTQQGRMLDSAHRTASLMTSLKPIG